MSSRTSWNSQRTNLVLCILPCTTSIGVMLPDSDKALASPASRRKPSTFYCNANPFETLHKFPLTSTAGRLAFWFASRGADRVVCLRPPIFEILRWPCQITMRARGEDGWEWYGYRLILFDLAALCQSSLTTERHSIPRLLLILVHADFLRLVRDLSEDPLVC